MDAVQIICTLKHVKSFLSVYPSDRLPHSIHQQTSTVILNTDPHTHEGTHWLAIHFKPKSSTAFYEGRSNKTGTFNFTGIKRDASVAVLHTAVSGKCVLLLIGGAHIAGQSTDGSSRWQATVCVH